MKYLGFFDYKEFIYGYESNADLFSIAHIIIMSIAIVVIIVAMIMLSKGLKSGKVKTKSIDTFLKVLAIIMPIWESVKIIWESYWDIKMGHGFNVGGLLPLYMCSMFIYVLPFAAYSKGRVRKCAVDFLATIGIVGGLSNFIFLNILGTYPIFTFASFVSIIFHFLMVFVGIMFWVTGYFKPSKNDCIYAFIPLFLFSLIVIPVIYIFKSKGIDCDYMLYMHGWGAPVLPSISDFFIKNNMQFVYTLIMMIIYFLIGSVIVLVGNIIQTKIIKKRK